MVGTVATLTLDDMSQMDITTEQALFGLELGLIYYCEEHSCYHNSPDTEPDEVVDILTKGAEI